MRSSIIVICFFFLVSLCILYSCKHKPFPAPALIDNYPDSIAAIFVTKCATTGCHDASGAINAGRLCLDSWDNLFKGSSHGAVVIPFSTDFSSLLYFINTDSARGTVSLPTMPYNGTPLSATEYNTIKNWIAAGAPDKNGNIPFASDPDTRQKIYITQQGCDLVQVIDGKSKLTMRMFPIGMMGYTESPHCIRITPDGKYGFLGFTSGSYAQKIDTRTDTVIASVNMQGGSGGILSISPDAQKIMMVDFNTAHLFSVDFGSMQATPLNPGNLIYPHGIVATPSWDTFYITPQYGNALYRYTPGKLPPLIKIPLDTAFTAVDNTSQIYSDPHEVIMTPDHSKIFVSCEFSDTVRVLGAYTYKVLAAIRVGHKPQEFAIAPSKHQIFVSCMEDAANPNPGCKGSVYTIDYNTLQLVGAPIYGDFYQPHGLAVDEQNNTLYIVSSNLTQDGPAPHHATKCTGNPGWYSVYNLTTLQPLNNIRYESTIAPYSADTRFKQ